MYCLWKQFSTQNFSRDAENQSIILRSSGVKNNKWRNPDPNAETRIETADLSQSVPFCSSNLIRMAEKIWFHNPGCPFTFKDISGQFTTS
jgi:hypothetical protein